MKQTRVSTAAGAPYNGIEYCSNVDPAGFYAVLWFDASVAVFKIYHGVGADYSATTKFAVFTTDGYLQRVNPNSKVFTTTSTFTTTQFVGSFYNNLIHTVNGTCTYASAKYTGGIDCETNPTQPWTVSTRETSSLS